MSREEAIDLLDNLIGMVEDNHKSDYDTALQMGIKALEQEPCEDVISRKDTLKAMIEQLGIRNEDYLLPAEATLYKVVKNMPPVTPQPKTGHWIDSLNRYFTQCSECGLHGAIGIYKNYGWCPKCGAKMIELYESEE